LATGSAPAVASWAAGRLDVVVQGTGHTIWQRWWDGAAWNGWLSLGGSCTGDPGAASRGPGILDVFCLGSTTNPSNLWHRSYQGTWSNWVQEVPGGWIYGIGAATWSSTRLDVLGADAASRALAHAWWDGQAWMVSSGTKCGAEQRPSSLLVIRFQR
jgi:hypothetical protein